MKKDTIQAILKSKIIAIIRGYDAETCLKISESLYKGGINLIEVTFNQAVEASHVDTAAAIKAINDRFNGDVLAGAGTVITMQQLQMAADAQAKYIISPNTDTKIIQKTCELGLVSMPGAFTPTEILTAYTHGADFVKLFPADCLGEGYMKAISAPINHVPLLAVGGVNEKNIGQYIKLGFKGVGVGSSLTNKEWIASGEYNKITELARKFVQNIMGQA